MIGPMHRLSQDVSTPARPPAVFPPPGERAPVQLSASPSRFGGSPDGDGSPRGVTATTVRAETPTASTVEVVRLLSLLADKTRLRILHILADGERPVVSLTAELKLPQPTVSHHLAWLRMMDLVSPRRQGKNVFYALGRAAAREADGSMTFTAGDTKVTVRTKRE